jgi:hypothetical protein
MVRFGSGMRQVLLDFFVKFAIGFGIGAAGDAVVEFTRAPILNDVGTFGDPNTSNYEYFTYGLGTFAVVAGVADLGLRSGPGVFGFTKHGIPLFAGIMAGTYFYEHTLTNLLGLRQWNPYELLSRLVPPVLPGSTPRPPGVVPGRPFPGSQLEGTTHPMLRA